MINQIFLFTSSGGSLQPDTGKTVEIYEYNASDVAGGSPNGSLIAAATEIGTGLYIYEYTGRTKDVTIAVNSLCKAGAIKVELRGELAREVSVDETASTLVGAF